MSTSELVAPAAASTQISTAQVIITMIESGVGISDLVFSPGRPPQVEHHAHLVAVDVPGLPVLRPEDTARIAGDLIAGHAQALATVKEQGACDFSYSIPERAR